MQVEPSTQHAQPRSVSGMAPPARRNADIDELRRRAAEERRRAGRAAALADAYLAKAVAGPERLRPLYARIADLHYRMRERQLAAARLHETYATRLERQASQPWTAPPAFMSAVTDTLGIAGAAAALYGRASRFAILVATSDATAKMAYDLEAELGEGPASTTMAEGTPGQAAGRELQARWPKYGQAVARLGIHSVTAVPLRVPAARLGVLCCYGAGPAATGGFMAETATVADALTPILVRASPTVLLSALFALAR